MPTCHKLARFFVLAAIILSSAALFLAVNAQATEPAPRGADQGQPRLWLPVVAKEDKWSRRGNVPQGVSRFYDVAVCGRDGEQVIFAGTNNGIYLYNAAQNNWVFETDSIPAGKIVPGLAFTALKEDGTCTGIYAASAVGVWYGHLAGSNWKWERIDENLSDAYSVLIVEDTLYAGGNFGIATITPLPTSKMATWTLSNQVATLTLSLIRNGEKTLAAVWGQGVFVEGKDPFNQPIWTRIGPQRTGVYEADTGTQDIVAAGTDSGLWRWTASSQWQETAVNFRNATFALKGVGSTLYAGQAKTGILRSVDGGLNWIEMNNELAGVNSEGFQVRGFHIGTDGNLYAATTTGVWEWSGQP